MTSHLCSYGCIQNDLATNLSVRYTVVFYICTFEITRTLKFKSQEGGCVGACVRACVWRGGGGGKGGGSKSSSKSIRLVLNERN